MKTVSKKKERKNVSFLRNETNFLFLFIAPGPPSNVSFPDVNYDKARIIWDTPEDPNGEIIQYRVMFHQNGSLDRQISREFQAEDRTFT